MDKITQRYIATAGGCSSPSDVRSGLLPWSFCAWRSARWPFIGTEFMPRLDEGSILVETRKLPGISLTDSVEISKRIEQTLRAFPEIADVVIKIGRPDFATEAMGINEGDTYLAAAPDARVDSLPHQGGTDRSRRQGIVEDPGSQLRLHAADGDARRRDRLRREGGSGHQGLRRRFRQRSTTWQNRFCAPLGRSAEPQIRRWNSLPACAELHVRVRRDALARYGLNCHRCGAGGGSRRLRRYHLGGDRRPETLHRGVRLPAAYRRDPDAMRDDPAARSRTANRSPSTRSPM